MPCSARLVIILGTIGVFMGPQYALAVFALDVLIVYAAALGHNPLAAVYLSKGYYRNKLFPENMGK